MKTRSRSARLAIIAGAALVGTMMFLMIRYNENDSIGRIEFFSASMMLAFTAAAAAAVEWVIKK